MYDILVWIDDDGDVVCSNLTERGYGFLRTLTTDFEDGQVLQIMCTPEEFANQVPDNVLVGMRMHPSGKVVPMEHPLLH